MAAAPVLLADRRRNFAAPDEVGSSTCPLLLLNMSRLAL
jgi:hypothetical protein